MRSLEELLTERERLKAELLAVVRELETYKGFATEALAASRKPTAVGTGCPPLTAAVAAGVVGAATQPKPEALPASTSTVIRFESSAPPGPPTDPAPSPDQVSTWPAPALPVGSYEHHVLQGYTFRWKDPPTDR